MTLFSGDLISENASNSPPLHFQVKQFIERYGKRLWKLRVLQAELKMKLRETAESPEQSFRFFVNTESGYSIDTNIYTAVEDPNSGVDLL